MSASIPPSFLPSAIQDRITVPANRLRDRAERLRRAELRSGIWRRWKIENLEWAINHSKKRFLLINLREVIGWVVKDWRGKRKKGKGGKVVGKFPLFGRGSQCV